MDDPASGSYGTFTLEGLGSNVVDQLRWMESGGLSSIFYVRVNNSEVNMLGTYVVTRDAITFKPRFLPDNRLIHEAYVNLDFLEKLGFKTANQGVERFELTFKVSKTKRTEVIELFPAVDTLPANVLRAYIHFSASMGLGNPYNHVKILDEKGRVVDEPFVELPEGMWDGSRTRLTLFFHPGRIKRGVGPNLTKGAVFEVGKRYTLVVDQEWLDGSGNKLASAFSKTWLLSEPVRQRINLSDWQIKTPSDSQGSLEVHTSQILDQALYPRMIEVMLAKRPIAGVWTSTGATYVFKPDEPWKPGDYMLKVDPKLEDITGNTLNAAFDVESKNERPDSIKSTIDFSVE